MKKLTLFAIALLASIASFAALNPFAYGLSSQLSADETKLTVNYSLNADATSVNIVVLNGETVVKHFSSNKTTKGSHTVEISTAELSNAHTPKGTTLTWRIEVAGSSVEAPTLQSESFSFCLPYGLDCDVDPESDYLGNWYVIEANAGAKGNSKYVNYQSYNVGRGLYAFNAALEGIKNKNGTYGFTGGVYVGASKYNHSTSASSPTYVNLYRVVTSGGRVFIGRFEPNQAPIVEADPADLNANFTEVLPAGKRVISIDAKGRGENLQLIMLDTDYLITEYDLGTAKSIAAESRTINKGNLSIVRNDATIAYDNEGGMWFNQNRATATATCPTIAHISSDNGFDYNNISGEIAHDNTNNSGIAVSPDGKQLAVVGAGTKTLTIYNISKTDGQISLTKAHTISTAGSNHTALSWDYAGNLYVANRSAETVTFYAMPYSGMVATPAPSKYAFQLQEEVAGTFYYVTVNVDETKGTVTGNDGQYEAGATDTLTATANRGYKFVNWTVGETNYTENPLTLTVNSHLIVTANFEALPAYTITATVNNEIMGSVTGAGTYYDGETVTLEATANTGHAFVDWSNNETANPLTFTATENVNLTANFEVLSYTVTALTNDETKGSVTGAGTYNYGTQVELAATPADGYELLYWSDRSTENPRTITVDGNEALSAYFVKEYEKEPTFTIEKVWENTTVPASSNNGYQAAGWDGVVYMKDRLNAAIWAYTSATDSALYVNTDAFTSEDANKGDQPIAIDDVGNIIIRSGSGLFYNSPKQVTIYKKGEKDGKVINFTLPASGRCDFISASGDIFSEEGGFVYFYCQHKTTVNRVKIANGAYVAVDQSGSALATGVTQSHIIANIFGNLVTHTKSANLNEINVLTNQTIAFSLPNHKVSTLGGCSFEFGGKELWAYNVGTTNYSSEWQLYNLTDKVALSNVLYAKDATSAMNRGSANWLNVQVVDEKTAYIYQFCPTVAIAVWKVTCDTGEEPEGPTSIENIETAPQAQKVLRDGQVLIIRDGKTYNMMGQEVK